MVIMTERQKKKKKEEEDRRIKEAKQAQTEATPFMQARREGEAKRLAMEGQRAEIQKIQHGLPTTEQQQEQEAFTEQQLAQPIPRAENIPIRESEGVQVGGLLSKAIPTLNLILGSSLGQAMTAKGILEDNPEDLVKLTTKMNEMGLAPEQITNDPNLQMMLKLELNEKDLEMIKSGEVSVSKLSQLVETIPFIGKKTTVFADELTITAGTKVSNVLGELKDIEGDMRTWRMFAQRNPQRADQYLDLTKEAEQRIYKLETKLKLLILQSPTLQANPEEVDTIISVIDGIKTRIRDNKDTLESASFLGTQIPIDQNEYS
jgi:hypothetical protein